MNKTQLRRLLRIPFLPAARNVEQEPHRRQRKHEVGASVAEKRQRVPRKRQHLQDRQNIDHRFERHPSGHARGQEQAQFVLRVPGDPESAPNQQDEQDQHDQRADEPQFLADDREDTVGVRRRQGEVLEPAGAGSYPEQAT